MSRLLADWLSDEGEMRIARIELIMVQPPLADSYVLVAYTTHGLALVYTLPHLEHIHTMQLKPEGFARYGGSPVISFVGVDGSPVFQSSSHRRHW